MKVQLFSAIGVGAILLHSLADFNLRIPANAMLAACLLGLYLQPAALQMLTPPPDPEEDEEGEKVIIDSRRSSRRRSRSNKTLKRLKQWFDLDQR